MTDYAEFLAGKRATVEPTGFEVAPESVSPKLFLYQREIVRWAVQLGRAALFEECGLGKTFQQVEWSRLVASHTNHQSLILAPLAVAHQTVGEAAKLGVDVCYAKTPDTMNDNSPVIVTNYQRLHLFEDAIKAGRFGGVALDESSILKNLGGKMFWRLVRTFEDTPFKLCCTATPAPNDYVEFSNHSTFLDIMYFKEVLSRWFTGDGKLARHAVLKQHAEADWWRWLTSWAVCLSHPRDLGPEYDLPGFDLPPLNLQEHRLRASDETIARTFAEGKLLPDSNPNSTTLHKVKRESLNDRVAQAVEIVEDLASDEPCVVWCDTDYEADALIKALKHLKPIEVRGSHKPERKEELLNAFSAGQERLIISKPQIAGLGLNWQHCAEHVMVGVSFSFEKLYQALRRSYRFGQTRPVNAHLIYAETEGSVMDTLKRKQGDFQRMQTKMNEATQEHGLFRTSHAPKLVPAQFEKAEGAGWTVYLGDCVPITESLPENSLDFGLHSPPFSSLYIYGDSDADMGNCVDNAEFFQHYDYLIRALHRATRPGRLHAVHCKDLPLFKNRDGAMGLYDFPGEIRAHFEAAGWVFHSRVTIWKDPEIEMERTNNHGLLHKSFESRAEVCRQGMADYLMVFRKWVDDDTMETEGKPVIQRRVAGDYIGTKPPAAWEIRAGKRTEERNYSIALWQRYASPVWFDIQQTRVLNTKQAKDSKDERHICPLQLDVIARCIDLWTNRGELVYDPFTGLGSTGYEALRMGRQFVGAELKDTYWKAAQKYLTEAAENAAAPTLFDLLDEHEAAQTAEASL